MTGNQFATPPVKTGRLSLLAPTITNSPDFAQEAHAAFHEFVTRPEFPCVGARAAFNSGTYVVSVYGELASDDATAALALALSDFTRSAMRQTSEYATFVAIFGSEGHASACPVTGAATSSTRHAEACPSPTDAEVRFERLLWQQLQKLNRLDTAHPWDPMASSDPADPQFSFSFAGQALYVIGLHPQSSRLARRFRWPTLVFNPHEQFEKLRADGKWKRIQQTIRERDMQLQGSINPMLSDFGEATEARQYSGRAVEDDWRAPFEPVQGAQPPAGCPFHRATAAQERGGAAGQGRSPA